MNLCAASCRRTASWSSRIQAASCLRIQHAVDGREQHRGDAAAQAVPDDDVARVVVVGAILDDELDLVVRASRSRFGQSILSASPLPGHFTSTILTTGAGTRSTLMCRRSRAGPSWPSSSSRSISGMDLLLEQRLAAGDLDQRAAVATPSATPPRRHLLPLGEGVGRVAPRARAAPQKPGRPACVDSP